MPDYPTKFCEHVLHCMRSRNKADREKAADFIKNWPKALKSDFEPPQDLVCQHCGNDTKHYECDHCCQPIFASIPLLQQEIPDEDEGNFEKAQAQRLMRVHRNLGHPSNRLLVQILTEAKSPQSTIDLAKTLKCSICERMRQIAPARPANPVRARELGEILALDFSYHDAPRRPQGTRP